MTTGNEWIEWTGGDCPVEKGAIVDVKHADGAVFRCAAGSDYAEDWSYEPEKDTADFDIIAYRVVSA